MFLITKCNANIELPAHSECTCGSKEAQKQDLKTATQSDFQWGPCQGDGQSWRKRKENHSLLKQSTQGKNPAVTLHWVILLHGKYITRCQPVDLIFIQVSKKTFRLQSRWRTIISKGFLYDYSGPPCRALCIFCYTTCHLKQHIFRYRKVEYPISNTFSLSPAWPKNIARTLNSIMGHFLYLLPWKEDIIHIKRPN